MRKIYLAIPYTGIEEESFKAANHAAAYLINKGNIVYSPISQSHTLAKEHSLPGNWEYWHDQDKAFIEWCDEVIIVLFPDFGQGLENVHNSTGVQGEMLMAKQFDKPVSYIIYDSVSKTFRQYNGKEKY